MIVLGIIGGVGSGKSMLARSLAEQGAALLEGDRLGHEVLAEPEVIAALVDRWGQAVLRDDGQIDRPVVAALVFAPPPGGPAELAFLEGVTHPRIGVLLNEQIEELRQQDTELVVVDAAVMLKAGWDRSCDHVVFVEVPRPVRLARCQARGWSSEEFERRERSQLPLETKKARADIMIDNSGTPQESVAALRKLLAEREIWPLPGDKRI